MANMTDDRVAQYIAEFPLDNDFVQVMKELDGLRKVGNCLVVGCLEEPTAIVLSDVMDVVGIDLRGYNQGDEYKGPEPCPYKHVIGDIRDVDITPNNFDLAVSISVIEHSGLGFYKDRVDEDGDIKAMSAIRNSLKTGGKAIITVPIGGEFIPKNATGHWRLYCPKTISRLTAGFKILKQRYFFTSYLGNGEATLADVNKNKTADISCLLVMEKLPEKVGGK